MTGVIRHYNTEKGFGFISSKNDDSIFFHISNIKNRPMIPEIGMSAVFDIIDTPKGEQASNIVLQASSNKFLHIGDLRIKFSNIKEYGVERNSSYNSAPVLSLDKRIGEIEREIAEYKQKISDIRRYIEKEVFNIGRENKFDSSGGLLSSLICDIGEALQEINSKSPENKAARKNKRIVLEQEHNSTIAMYEQLIESRTRYAEQLRAEKNETTNDEKYRLSQNNQLECLYIKTFQNEEYVFWKHEVSFDIHAKLKEIDENI